jgi:hypothetical protein
MLTALLLTLSAPVAATSLDELAPRLVAVRQFAGEEGEQLWPGYGLAPFGFLLLGEREEELLCHDSMPVGFVEREREPVTGCRRSARPSGPLPRNLLAAMPLFGPRSVIVMGTPASTGQTEAAWTRTILHEHFHQWQYSLPSYFSRTQALDLHGGDETGLWVLNYPFPYSSKKVDRAFREASERLSSALNLRGAPGYHRALRDYLLARRTLARSAGTRNWRYFELQLWQEGVARWTEIELGKRFDDQSVRETALALEARTLDDGASQSLAERRREVVYAFGAAEAMLLESCGSAWRAAYTKTLALGPLLEEAGRSCRTTTRP